MDDLLAAIKCLGLWDYLNYELLENIIKEYATEGSGLHAKLEEYQGALGGFKLSIMLDTYIEFVQPESEECQLAANENLLPEYRPDSAFYTTLQVKVNITLTEHSLEYIFELKRHLCQTLSLPPLTLILDRIARGCVCVTWRIPTEFASQVTRAVHAREEELGGGGPGTPEYSIMQCQVSAISVAA